MMKIRNIFAAFIILSLLLPTNAVLAGGSDDVDPGKLVYPPMSEIEIPTPEVFELPNGMKFFLIEDDSLPLIELTAFVKVSSLFDPPAKKGLASITGTVMRTGGTKKWSGDEIDLKLESVASIVETGISQDRGTAYLNCLKENFDKSLAILVDILKNPRFDDEKIKQAKVEQKSAISRRNDDVSGIAIREFNRMLWGFDSAQSRIPEYDTINAIAKEDLVNFHKKYFVPNHTIIGVVGDFDADDMKKKLTAAFKDWKKVEVKLPEIDVKTKSEKKVGYIFKEDTNQSNIWMGFINPEIKYSNPDFAAMNIMSVILGESFASRMFKEVRTKRGLAYSTRGYIDPDWNDPGSFKAMVQTKLESTAEAIDTMIGVIDSMKQDNITENEFKVAKNYWLNSYVFEFDKKRDVLSKLLQLEYNGYPLDYYQKFRKDLEKVTIEDINRVSKKYLDTSNLNILVVGQKDKFDAPLSKYGEVTEIDITIPEPEAEALPEATEETKAKGVALLKKVFEAYGGEKRLKENLNRVEDFVLTYILPQGQFDMNGKSWSIYPLKQRQEIQSPQGKFTRILNGNKGINLVAGQTMPMKKEEIKNGKKDQRRELRWLVRNYHELTIYHAGIVKDNDKTLERIVIKEGDEYISTFVIDPENSHLVKKIYNGKDPMTGSPAKFEEVKSDFKKVKGILIPHLTELYQGGELRGKIFLKGIELDVEIDPAKFEIPEKKK